MSFVLRMALREVRSSWRRLLFFFVSIAVGVAAIVAMRSVIQSVRDVFGREARTLVAGDVLISTNRPWTPEARAVIDRRLAEAGVLEQVETVETPTMVRPADPSMTSVRMVELRAVSPGFPLYGTVGLESGQTYSHSLLENRGALVRPELLTALGVAVGDAVMIGEAAFTIRGVITIEPGRRVGNFSLGPRVLVDFNDMAATGLLTFGSRVRRVILVRVPEAQIEPLVSGLRESLAEEFVNARSYRGSDDEVGRDFERAENYLSLVGLVIVILGGIAVSSVTRVFVLQKMKSIAVLKCLGATTGQVIGAYLLQVMLLGLAGSLLGVALAHVAVGALSSTLAAGAPLLAEADYGVTRSAAVQGVAIGVLVSLLFSVVPLLHVRLVKPSLLLRDEPARTGRDVVRAAALVLVSAALVALTAWQAASLQVGLSVCAGFAVVAVVLQEAGRLLVRALAPLTASPSFPLRHAVLHLSRPGNQTRVVLLAVGLGAFFIVGVRALQASLLEELSLEFSEDSPDMFLMDIQRDQAERVRAFLTDGVPGSAVRLIPVLRARVIGVDGRDVALETLEDVRARGGLSREYTITYRDHVQPNERVVAGTFWDGPSPEGEVSVERELSERVGIALGDTMRFDVLGREVAARVSSIREVDWRDSRNGGFMFVFRPGLLDEAPQNFIAPLKGPDDPAVRGRFQHDLVQAFPNVTVIDFREILLTVRDVMGKVTLAISVVGGLVLFSGVLILVGAVAMTKFQRVYEAAVFKTLGASTRTIARMLLFEYGVLGLLAGLIGSAAAVVLTWGVSRFALEIPWRIFVGEHVTGVILTGALVAVIGVLSSLDVLRHKPLATLRAE
jgi:putative ABC transport system permease protein